jgi:hypothetical protein
MIVLVDGFFNTRGKRDDTLSELISILQNAAGALWPSSLLRLHLITRNVLITNADCIRRHP